MISGVVQKINVKPWGDKTLYSFFLKGQDGMFSLGERAPQFQAGDSIKFETRQQGKYVNAINVVPWTDGGTTQAPEVSTVARSGGRSTYVGRTPSKSSEERDYWAKKDATQEVTQKRIEIQAARNAAIEAAKFLIEKEFVKSPTKQADKYDTYLALVNQLTDEFIKNTSARLGAAPSQAEPAHQQEEAEAAPPQVADQGQWD